MAVKQITLSAGQDTPVARSAHVVLEPSMSRSVLLTMPDYCGSLAAARCLGRSGYEVWMSGDSLRAPAMHSKFVTRKFMSPPVSEPDEWLRWLVETGEANPGAVLYPTSDDLAWLLALHAPKLEPFFKLWAPPVEVYETLLDKALLAAACAKVGLETPHTLAPTDEASLEAAVREAKLPVLIKQRTQVLSKTNHKGVMVRERSELAAAFRAFRDSNRHHAGAVARMPNASQPLLQQYFSEGVNGSLQVSGFIDETGKLFVARAAKKLLQRPKTLGISLCLEATPLPRELAERIRALCLEVGYFGVFGIEFLQVDGRALLIDFNPRYYHFMALDIARGMPLPVMTALAACGEWDRLEAEVRRAQVDVPGVDAFTYRFQLKELLLAQAATGTMPVKESLRWWQWYRGHHDSLVDAVDDAGDHLPHVVDVAAGIARRLRHPMTFIRRVALDR
jgi:predicted ATP-grasp superfamily ATP-dependent carboligase